MVEIKEEFKQRLDTALAVNNMKPVDLARATGISESTISQYRSGYSKPKDKRLVKIANVLHVDPAWLMGVDVSMRSGKPPIYEAAAGEGRINDGYPSDNMSLTLDDDQYYFNVCGQSMEPTLQDGDIVVVSATNVVKSQEDIMLVKINGDKATLKHVKIQENGLYLYGENHAVYPARFFSAKEVEELPVTIEGVVVRLIRNM